MPVTEEELRVLVTAEVDKAIKEMSRMDKQTKASSNEFKQLGKAIAAGFSAKAIIDFTRQSVAAYQQDKQALDILRSTITATGAAAWTSVNDLDAMAQSLQDVTNYSAGTIESMQAVLLGFKNIKGDNFTQATKAILDMATVMKTDLSSAAQSVGKALDDPINGIDSLRKQGFNFSAAQKKLMQDMIDTGDIAGAQKIILDELATTFGGAAEAGVVAGEQVKNAWNDLKSGIGEFVSELPALVLGAVGEKGLGMITQTLNTMGQAFADFSENIRFLQATLGNTDAYVNWYDALSNTDRLKEAQRNIAVLTKQMAELEENSQEWSEKFNALDTWKHEERSLQYIIKEQEKAAKIAAERKAAEDEINELMFAISQKYENLGKDDPVIQLEKYKKQLEKIAAERAKLLKPVKDTDGTIIDTSKAQKELDYIENEIRKKMSELRDGEKKSWKKWLSDILKIDADAFGTGKEAAELYIQGLSNGLQSDQKISSLLGNSFDLVSALEKQQDEVEKKLSELLTIDPRTIDESFKIEDQIIQGLIKKYGELKAAKGAAYGEKELADIQKQIADITKTEKELYLEKLKTNGATEAQITEADRLYDEYKKLKDAGRSWTDTMQEGLTELILKYSDLDKASAGILANMGTELMSMSFDSAITGFQSLGEALGKGSDAGESLQQALANMAETILDQLPMMFLQAGLQLIANGMWPIGLGFIAAAGSSAMISGFVKGRTSDSSASANALGGVYDTDGALPFAKGGTFTNAIVQSPTFFRFASGAGFGLGLMGEAGPEAVMPLSRGADGALGVNASGIGGMQFALRVVINNYSTEEVSATETVGDDGQRQLEVTIGTLINGHISSGKADKALSARYGIKAQGV